MNKKIDANLPLKSREVQSILICTLNALEEINESISHELGSLGAYYQCRILTVTELLKRLRETRNNQLYYGG